MAQTLLLGNISEVYDKLVFQKEDGKLYYSDTVGDDDVLMFGNLEDVALSTWSGTVNITTLGAIGAGTWNATTIAVDKGGSGQTSYTNGQLLIGNTTGNTLAKGTITGTTDEVDVTLGAGTIQIGMPDDVTIGNHLTIGGDRLVFDGGARIDMPDASTLQFSYTDKYRFIASDSVGTCIVELVADGGTSNWDWNRIEAKETGELTFQNKNSGAFGDTLTITKYGGLVVHGNVIQNSQKENTLILTLDQKLQINSNILQNTSNEDVLELTGDQSIVVENDIYLKGDTIMFNTYNDKFVNSDDGTIQASCDNFSVGTGFQPAKLFLIGSANTDSTITYLEGGLHKWEVGYDATDSSIVWSLGSLGLGTSDRMKLTSDGVLRVISETGGNGRFELYSDAGSAGADKWAILATETGNSLLFKNKIAGIEQTYLTITPHATPSLSNFVVAGYMRAPHLQLDVGLATDIISEVSVGAGVTIDGVTIKDDLVDTPKGAFPYYVYTGGEVVKINHDNWQQLSAAGGGGTVLDPISTSTIGEDGFPGFIFEAPFPCKVKSCVWLATNNATVVCHGALWKTTWIDGDDGPLTAAQIGTDLEMSGGDAGKCYRTEQSFSGSEAILAQGDILYFYIQRQGLVVINHYTSLYLTIVAV